MRHDSTGMPLSAPPSCPNIALHFMTSVSESGSVKRLQVETEGENHTLQPSMAKEDDLRVKGGSEFQMKPQNPKDHAVSKLGGVNEKILISLIAVKACKVIAVLLYVRSRSNGFTKS